jgi:hypothetical protein
MVKIDLIEIFEGRFIHILGLAWEASNKYGLLPIDEDGKFSSVADPWLFGIGTDLDPDSRIRT